MADAIPRLETFASSVRRDGFTDIVLLGMGGSSLAPEVLRAVLGVAPDWPRFHMLDSTDPAAVRAVATSPARTLYILASKSGTTIEPNSLAAHFRHGLEASVPHGTTTSSRSPTKGPSWRGALGANSFEMSSSIRPTSAGAIRRCRFSASSLRR